MKLTADFHTHTVFSHGKGTILENALSAKTRGLKKIAITDHGHGHPVYGIRSKKVPYMLSLCKKATYETGVEVVLGVEELGPHYEIIVTRKDFSDRLEICVELLNPTDTFSELERITAKVKNKLKTVLGLDAKITLVSPNTLQRFEGKAKRVKDLRPKE